MNQHFGSLVMGLVAQAGAALEGKLPPGAVAAGASDPIKLAQAFIDTLAMLEEKTRGNLDEIESRMLAQSLTELRFRFVQLTASKSR